MFDKCYELIMRTGRQHPRLRYLLVLPLTLVFAGAWVQETVSKARGLTLKQVATVAMCACMIFVMTPALPGGGAAAVTGVCQIGNTCYSNLSEAVTNAQSGDVIWMTADDNTSQSITIDKALTIELQGFTLSNTTMKIIGTSTTVNLNDRAGTAKINSNKASGFTATEISRCDSTIYITGGATLTINGQTGTSVSTGTIISECASRDLEKAIFLGNGRLIVNGGTFVGTKSSGCDALFVYNGSVTINDGYFYSNCGLSYNTAPSDANPLVIRKGIFDGGMWLESSGTINGKSFSRGTQSVDNVNTLFLSSSSGSNVLTGSTDSLIKIGCGLFLSGVETQTMSDGSIIAVGSTDSAAPEVITQTEGNKITLQPQIIGGDGSSDITYQWKKDGADIVSGTNSNYVIENYIPSNDNGSYSVTASQGNQSISIYYQIGESSGGGGNIDPPDTITVTYNGNGGGDTVTGVPAPQVKVLSEGGTGAYFTIASPQNMKREGYTFLKWSTDTNYPQGDPYKVNHDAWIQENITLYAIWGKNVLEVTAPDSTKVCYPTLSMAFEKAPSGSTIKVLENYEDIEEVGMLFVDSEDVSEHKIFTLDLNGKTVTGHLQIGNGALTIMDSGEGGTLTGMINQLGGELTINGGNIGALLTYAYSTSDEHTPTTLSKLHLNGGSFQGLDMLGNGTQYGIAVISDKSGEDAKVFLENALAQKKQSNKEMLSGSIGGQGDMFSVAYFIGPVSVIDKDGTEPEPDDKTLDGTITGQQSITYTGVTAKLVAIGGREYVATITKNTTTVGSPESYEYTVTAPSGQYNLVVTATMSDSTAITVTSLINLTRNQTQNVDLPSGKKTSKVDISDAGAYKAIVGGLEQLANSIVGDVVEIKLTIKAKDGNSADNANSIKEEAPGKTLDFIDLTLTKTVNGVADQDIGNTNTQIISIVIPFDKTGKSDITVYRYHGGSASAMAANPNDGEEGYIVGDTTITIYAKKFSTYAIGYTEGSGTPDTPGRPTGQSVPAPQKPTISTDEGADVTLSADGITAEIKVKDGYELEDVTVNGISKGKVTKLTGLKTGDKVIVTTKKTLAASDAARIEQAQSTKLVARSRTTTLHGKTAVKVYWYAENGEDITKIYDGYVVYRSTKRSGGYGTKPFFETKKTSYINNLDLEKGNRYHYKVYGYVEVNGQRYYSDQSLKAWRTIR